MLPKSVTSGEDGEDLDGDEDITKTTEMGINTWDDDWLDVDEDSFTLSGTYSKWDLLRKSAELVTSERVFTEEKRWLMCDVEEWNWKYKAILQDKNSLYERFVNLEEE